MSDGYVVSYPRSSCPPFATGRDIARMDAAIFDDVEALSSREDHPQGFVQWFVRRLYHEPVLGHSLFLSAWGEPDSSAWQVGLKIAGDWRAVAEEVPAVSGTIDHISVVLRECEEKLRTLATEGRLSGNALTTFTDLSTRIRQEIDRRNGNDRRESARTTPDRRVTADEPLEAAAAGEWVRERTD